MRFLKKAGVLGLCSLICMATMPFNAKAGDLPEAGCEERVEELLSSMTLEQKIAQLIMPAVRHWKGENLTDLAKAPELAAALRLHQYGGLILFGQNVVETEQTLRLVSDLQANNAQSSDALETGVIPYLIAADQEGGAVARLNMGTRGTGSMAIGATGEKAEENAQAIGTVFGEELSALGINVNLGPCIDRIVDLTDLGLSTRVYSDDPETISRLGLAFGEGVGESPVITCYKHFPGAGDGSDYPTSIWLTREELEEGGLATYRAAVENGAELIMTSATTFPLIDQEIFMADGFTKGFYPATLSPLIVTKMLREELGFDGVVITDALEMEQFVTEPDNGKEFFTGEYGSVLHDLQVAEKALHAGCDLLLIPTDLVGEEAVQYYEEYIEGLASFVEQGILTEERIEESVRRILRMKERHGILDLDVSGADVEARVEAAKAVVGSAGHHEVEQETAREAITLLKNDGTIPLMGQFAKAAIIGRTDMDDTPITYGLGQLFEEGFFGEEVRVEDHIRGETTGPADAPMQIVVDRYYDTADGGKLVESPELDAAIEEADVVICLSAVGAGIDALQDSSLYMQGVSRTFLKAREAGARFVLLSDNLPVDAARFNEADAIVCAYLSAGFGVDPTARTNGWENPGAFNANVPAALRSIFGAGDLPGRLPINIPVLHQNAEGLWEYGNELLYERGYSAAE